MWHFSGDTVAQAIVCRSVRELRCAFGCTTDLSAVGLSVGGELQCSGRGGLGWIDVKGPRLLCWGSKRRSRLDLGSSGCPEISSRSPEGGQAMGPGWWGWLRGPRLKGSRWHRIAGSSLGKTQAIKLRKQPLPALLHSAVDGAQRRMTT